MNKNIAVLLTILCYIIILLLVILSITGVSIILVATLSTISLFITLLLKRKHQRGTKDE